MKAQIGRELDRRELLLGQIAAIEAERDAMLARQAEAEAVQGAQGAPARVQKPMDLNGPGAETVAMLWTEAFYRLRLDNRHSSPLSADWRERRGRAARSITNASRWAITACARR